MADKPPPFEASDVSFLLLAQADREARSLALQEQMLRQLARQKEKGGEADDPLAMLREDLKSLPAAMLGAVGDLGRGVVRGAAGAMNLADQQSDQPQSLAQLFGNLALGGWNAGNLQKSLMSFYQSRAVRRLVVPPPLPGTAEAVAEAPAEAPAEPPALPWHMREKDVAGLPLLDPDFAGFAGPKLPPPLPAEFYHGERIRYEEPVGPPAPPRQGPFQAEGWQHWVKDRVHVNLPVANDEVVRSTKEEKTAAEHLQEQPRLRVEGMESFNQPRVGDAWESRLPLGRIPVPAAEPEEAPPGRASLAHWRLRELPAEPTDLPHPEAPKYEEPPRRQPSLFAALRAPLQPQGWSPPALPARGARSSEEPPGAESPLEPLPQLPRQGAEGFARPDPFFLHAPRLPEPPPNAAAADRAVGEEKSQDLQESLDRLADVVEANTTVVKEWRELLHGPEGAAPARRESAEAAPIPANAGRENSGMHYFAESTSEARRH